MRKIVIAFVAATVCFGMHGFFVEAQQGSSASRFAVIDISHIFKNHAGFKQQMEEMKREVEAFEASLRDRGKQIEQLRNQLKAYNSGTPPYKQVEEQIAKVAAEGQAQTQLKRKDFLEREAKIYYSTYMEITRAVEQFAERNNISLVVRFNSAPINSGDGNSVLEGVNRAVVYQKNLNITDYVLKMLNSNMARKPGNSGAATPR